MIRIFLSYTTRDNYLNDKRLCDVFCILSQYGVTYIDALHNDSEDKQLRVLSELASSNIVVFLKTSSFFKSPWTLFEYEQAVEHKKKIIEIYAEPKNGWREVLRNIEIELIMELSTNHRFKVDCQNR